MTPQPFRRRDAEVVRRFLQARRGWRQPPPRLKLSWSNWGFGTEPLQVSGARLAAHGIRHIELHGNLYGPDLGYRVDEVRTVLGDHGITVAGICGIVTPDQELASVKPHVRQRAIDYFRRQADFCAALGGVYVLFGAAAVGRPVAYDDSELLRAADTLRVVADHFVTTGVRGAVEPIRPEETSLVHSFADAIRLVELVDHPGVAHINGDLYHMLAGEEHIGLVLLEHGDRLANLHMADTNRRALGAGLLDLDVVLMALYAVGYHADPTRGWCTPEPLGAGGDPYRAMHGTPDPAALDALVRLTAATFFEREQQILAAGDGELLAAYGLDEEALV